MKSKLLGLVVYCIYRLLVLSWKISWRYSQGFQSQLEKGKPFILAHWHGDELALMHVYGKFKLATMVSMSRDGQLMNQVLSLFGAQTSRGSSSRGAVAALKGLLRLVRAGYSCTMAVDGPRGPIYQVKPGVFEIAKLSGLPIFYITASTDRAFVFERSWNKAYLPKPFAKVFCAIEGPFELPPGFDPKDRALAERLAAALHSAKASLRATIADAVPR
ncbi:MAG: lysophospholipid acyltransferase family protein [Bdellovibrionaceae bacterium]|nr:lysophospholipid acyltransferase family protein [Pseudobdellovibrionaceae bacterium]